MQKNQYLRFGTSKLGALTDTALSKHGRLKRECRLLPKLILSQWPRHFPPVLRFFESKNLFSELHQNRNTLDLISSTLFQGDLKPFQITIASVTNCYQGGCTVSRNCAQVKLIVFLNTKSIQKPFSNNTDVCYVENDAGTKSKFKKCASRQKILILGLFGFTTEWVGHHKNKPVLSMDGLVHYKKTFSPRQTKFAQLLFRILDY